MFKAALVSLALVVLGPLATRIGWIRFPAGLAMLALGTLSATVVVLMALVASVRGSWSANLTALLVGLVALAVPVFQLLAAGRPPPIHDITTDVDDPPTFVALLPLRGADASTPDYDGMDAAAAQRRAYPDIVPLSMTEAPAEAFARAERSARALGWTVVSSDPALGRLEATATTFWFHFTDDVVIRIRREGSGSRLDIRSKSRVGRGDLGANARRIRTFVGMMQQASQVPSP